MKKMKNFIWALVAIFLSFNLVYAAYYATPDTDGEVAYREKIAIKRKVDGWHTYTTDVVGLDDGYVAVGYDCPINDTGAKLDVKGLSQTYCTGFINIYDKEGNSLKGYDVTNENGNRYLLGVTKTKNGYVVLGDGDRTVDSQSEESTFILELDKDLKVVHEEQLHTAMIDKFVFNHLASYEDKVVVAFDSYVFVYDAATDKVSKLLDNEGYLPAVAIDKTGIYVSLFDKLYNTIVKKYDFDLKVIGTTELYTKDSTKTNDLGLAVNLNIVGDKLVASLTGSMSKVNNSTVPPVTNMLVSCGTDLKNVKHKPVDFLILDFVESRGDIAFIGYKTIIQKGTEGDTPVVSIKDDELVFSLPDLAGDEDSTTVYVRGKYKLDGNLMWSRDYAENFEAIRIDRTLGGLVVAGYNTEEEAGYTIAYEYELFEVATKTDGNGKITTNKVMGAEGEVVEFTITPNEGYILKRVVVTNEFGQEIEFTENKFTLPSADVEIYAEFEKLVVPNPSTGINNPYVSLGLIAAMATCAFIILKKKKYI